MRPIFSFTCIPLDLRSPSECPNSFDVRIVTHIHFPAGSVEGTAIGDALRQHPLLSQPVEQPIKALVWDFQSWLANGRTMNTAAATSVALHLSSDLKRTPDEHRSALLRNLMHYLGSLNASVTAAAINHDPAFDALTADDFVDIAKIADDVKELSASLQLNARRSLQATPSAVSAAFVSPDPDRSALHLDSLSFGLAKWVNSSARAALLESIRGAGDDAGTGRVGVVSSLTDSMGEIRAGIGKIVRRVTTPERRDGTLRETIQLMAKDGEAGSEVDGTDPNVAIQAALKTALLARECGLVTNWTGQSQAPIPSDRDYVIQLDLGSLVGQKTRIDIDSAMPTAFRRSSHTHPVAFVDLGSTARNGALAALNRSGGDVRYRASAINTEVGLVKDIILQTHNSIADPADGQPAALGDFNENVDRRPPDLLKNAQYGGAEPETTGVTFSAPVEDLMTPQALRFDTPQARMAAMPCLFLEDLWVGYRLDLKDSASRVFTSIHRQVQRIVMTQSGTPIEGLTEDYVEREQPDDPAVGHSSSELATYNGLSVGQSRDYLIVLGMDKPSFEHPGQPFKVEQLSYYQTEPLTFGHTYEYRLRNVFLGGVSCASDDPGLNNLADVYRQTFPFFRAKALRAGEILGSTEKGDDGGRTIYLTAGRPQASITLLPTPIDLDGSRFHGVLFAGAAEPERHAHRRFISDLSKAFETIPPDELDYFYDPDVYGVTVRAKVVNGEDRLEPEDLHYVNDTYCSLKKHLVLDPVTEHYGEAGKWETFRPIVISFRTASRRELPGMHRRGLFRGCQHIEVAVPPAAEIHLSLVPVFDPGLLTRNASAVASSTQLTRLAQTALADQHQSVIPVIAEQLVKVIHAVEQPRRAPHLYCEDARVRPAARVAGDDLCVGGRELDSEFADVTARVDLDAASTKEVRLEATWSDVLDEPHQARYVFASGTASSMPRSILFQEFEPLPPSAENFHRFLLAVPGNTRSESVASFRVSPSAQFGFVEQFMLQCAEDKLFLGRQEELPLAPATGTSAEKAIRNAHRLNVKDQRRKILKVEAVAVSRFADKFGSAAGNKELRSEKVVLDIPASVRMTAPNVSHVVPLRKKLTRGDEKSGTLVTTFGMRLYLRRPWFESGIGERLAIACTTGSGPTPGPVAEVPKHITQWGEDPLERAGLETTTRLPRASDFIAVDSVGAAGFAADLYPGLVGGADAPVIYRDSVSVSPTQESGEIRWVSVASYAVRFDEHQQLWYADVYVQGDFFGWCGLALYRHQPHAHPERELSPASDWVYAAVLYGEPVTWLERDRQLFVTIGPIYDESVSFEFDSLEYSHGVSREVRTSNPTRLPLKSYRVGDAIYFEGILPKKNFDWGLLKKRFNHVVKSGTVSH